MDIPHAKSEILSALTHHGIQSYYEEKLGTSLSADSNGWTRKALCPIHGDKNTPNLSVNIHTGGFQCFSCQAKGSIFDFECLVNGMDPKTSFIEALKSLADRAGFDIKTLKTTAGGKTVAKEIVKANETELADQKPETIIPNTKVEEYISKLEERHYKYLAQKRGLSLETIRKRKIGYDSQAPVQQPDGTWIHGRLTLPVYGAKAELDTLYPCRNIRRYSPLAKPDSKMVNTKGHGSPIRLYPLEDLLEKNWKHVFICEGEWDAILLNQLLEEAGPGNEWGAVTGTGGAGSFRFEWIKNLIGRHIYFIYDVDEPGKAAVANHLNKYLLSSIRNNEFLSVRHVILPLAGTKQEKDVGDYFLKCNGTIEALLQLAFQTPTVSATTSMLGGEASTVAEELESFVACVNNRRYIDKRVTVPITISGHTSHTYHAPRSYKVIKCEAGDKCCSKDCGEKIIPLGHDLFIKACMAKKNDIYKTLQCMACTEEQEPQVVIVDKVVMKEYFAHQVIDRWRAEENKEGKMENCQELCTVPVYIMQPEQGIDIQPQNYIATGWVRSHPNTQQVTLFIEQLESLEDDWKSFSLDNKDNRENFENIRKFKPKQILEVLTNEVTRIYKSDEILLSVLLTYLSPLRFVFNGEHLRGWIKLAIIGDSGTGKSRTYSAICDWLNLGDLFSVLSGSRTGLLYAIKQKGGEWYVSTGRYVAANKKIIAIDEAQEFEADELRKMGIAMDEGFLDISHVASGGYRTEVRTILLLNPKNGKTISDFPFGVKAITECFSPMFIRRLDIAIFCTGKDDVGFYNQKAEKTVDAEQTIKPEWIKSLIYWAWTRSINDINWTEEATETCLDQTTILAEKFGSADDAPLVSPQDFRKNLARLSTAFAILDCSFTEDLKGLIVEPRHVKAMAKFVDTLYSSMSCNLIQYSKLNRKRKKLDDFDNIRTNFESFIDRALSSGNQDYANQNYFCQMLVVLQQSDYFRVRDIQEQLGISMAWTRKYINVLQGYNLVEPVKGGFKPTRKYNMFIQKWTTELNPETGKPYSIKGKPIEDMMAEVHLKIGEKTMNADASAGLNYAYDENGSNMGDEAPDYEKINQELR